MRCPSCRSRPVRRACPALGTDICPVCCGTRRGVEIACPDSCRYLTASRTHPPAVTRKQQDRDMALLLPGLMELADGQQRLFFLSLTLISRFRGEGLEAARDADVADAAGSLAATYETESKGLIYEHRAGSVPARRMATELRTVFDRLGSQRPSAFSRDAIAVLRLLERLAREGDGKAGGKASGDGSAFLALAGRVADRIGATAEDPGIPAASEGAGDAVGGSIILP